MKRKDELYHFGVKGMKWGVRNDPKKAAASLGAVLLYGAYERRKNK